MELPIAVFLDTNVLKALSENLESAELSAVVEIAERLGCRVFVPDVVAREFCAHRVKALLGDLGQYEKASGHIAKHCQGFEPVRVGFTDVVSGAWQTSVRALKGTKARIYRLRHVNMRRMITNAAFYHAPFQHANRGFKDELIVLTMLEVADTWSYGAVLLVSDDNVFSDKTIRKRFVNDNVEFKVVSTIGEAAKILTAALDEELREEREELCAGAVELSNDNWEFIAWCVREKWLHAGIPTNLLPGTDFFLFGRSYEKLLEIVPMGIIEATVAEGEEEEERLSFTLEVKCSVYLERAENQVDVNTAHDSVRVTVDGKIQRWVIGEEVVRKRRYSINLPLEASGVFDGASWGDLEVEGFGPPCEVETPWLQDEG